MHHSRFECGCCCCCCYITPPPTIVHSRWKQQTGASDGGSSLTRPDSHLWIPVSWNWYPVWDASHLNVNVTEPSSCRRQYNSVDSLDCLLAPSFVRLAEHNRNDCPAFRDAMQTMTSDASLAGNCSRCNSCHDPVKFIPIHIRISSIQVVIIDRKLFVYNDKNGNSLCDLTLRYIA